MSGTVRAILHNVSWLVFERGLRLAGGLVIGAWVARYLSPERFGLLNYSVGFASLFAAVATLGLPGVLVRELVRAPGSAGTVLGTSLVLRLGASLVAYVSILMTFAVVRPGDCDGFEVMAIVGLVTLLQSFEIVDSWFQAEVKSRYTAIGRIVAFVIGAAVRVVLITSGAGLLAFAVVLVAETVVSVLVSLVSFRWVGNRFSEWRFSVNRARELLLLSWPLVFEGIMISIYMRIDQVMLGSMCGDAAAGVYSAATRVSEVWYFLPVIIVDSVTPRLIQSKCVSVELYQARLCRLFQGMLALSLPIALVLTVFAHAVILALYGRDYIDAAPILAVHAWAAPFVFLGVAQNPWNINEGVTILAFRRAAMGAVTNVALNLVLIPWLGGLGAAIATVVSYAIAAWLGNLMSARTRPVFLLQLKAMGLHRLLWREVA